MQIPEDVAYPNENMEVEVEENPVQQEVEVEENPVQEVEVEENLSNEQRLLIRHLKSKINNRLFLYRHLITFDLNDLDTRSRQSYEVVRSAVQCFNLSGSYTKEEVISSYRRLALEYHPDKVLIPEIFQSTNTVMSIINKFRKVLIKWLEII